MKLFIVLILLIFSGCSKLPQYMSTATITGFDYRMAPCTGGTFILIDEHPNPNNADHLFDIANMPSTIKLDNKTKFPIKVAIDWKPESNCFGNYITITRIRIII